MKKELQDKHYKLMKKISQQKIDIKKNLQTYRMFQKIINPIHKHSKYEDVEIQLHERKVRLRVFNDFSDNKDHKILIYFHGGGWVSGSIDSYTNACYDLSVETEYIVILVDYRLAPEFKYPAGFNDCYEITNLITNNSKLLRITKRDIVIVGDSAGGNLATAVALKARDTKDFKVNKLILLYPALQTDYSLNAEYRSLIDKGEDYLLTRQHMEEFINLYINSKDDLDDPYVSPLCATSFKKLPKMLLLIGEHDPLKDECHKFKEKIEKEKGEITFIEYKNAVHGFISNIFGKFQREQLYEDINKFLGDNNEEE